MGKVKKYLLFLFFVAVCLLLIKVNKPARANMYFDPHGNYDNNTAGCAVCHYAHFSTGSPLLSRTLVKRLCYSCHDGSESNYNVKAEFGELDEGGSSHPSYHPVPDGLMTCADCHNPHLTTGDDPGILSVGEFGISSRNAVCGVCHQ